MHVMKATATLQFCLTSLVKNKLLGGGCYVCKCAAVQDCLQQKGAIDNCRSGQASLLTQWLGLVVKQHAASNSAS